VASDDLEWCYKVFSHLPDVYFVERKESSEGNEALFDFTVLANCDLSIIRYAQVHYFYSLKNILLNNMTFH